jgi:UDP-glucose 4-epimerase
MRVLVTGATGNIGTSVIEALSADPAVDRIVGLARRRPDWSPTKTEFVEADVRSADLAALFRGADAVVHLAWVFQPTHDPLATWGVNVLGGIRVFDAAAEAGVRALVYSSSVGAYSPAQGRHVDESWPTHGLPTAAYGREKAYLERYLDAFELRYPQLRVARLRPAFVFKRQAASEQWRIFAGRLLPRAVARPGRLPVLPLPAGLRFQAVHADDLAEVFRLATTTDARGAFNVAAEPVLDHSAIGEIFGARPLSVPARPVRALLGAAWRLRAVPADDALLQLLLGLPTLDTGRVRREFGWSPRHSGADALREMLSGLADGAGMSTPPLRPADD